MISVLCMRVDRTTNYILPETRFFGLHLPPDSLGLSSTIDVTQLAVKAVEFTKQPKIAAIMLLRLFKVTDFATNEKLVCNFLLVIIELFSLRLSAKVLQARSC